MTTTPVHEIAALEGSNKARPIRVNFTYEESQKILQRAQLHPDQHYIKSIILKHTILALGGNSDIMETFLTTRSGQDSIEKLGTLIYGKETHTKNIEQKVRKKLGDLYQNRLKESGKTWNADEQRKMDQELKIWMNVVSFLVDPRTTIELFPQEGDPLVIQSAKKYLLGYGVNDDLRRVAVLLELFEHINDMYPENEELADYTITELYITAVLGLLNPGQQMVLAPEDVFWERPLRPALEAVVQKYAEKLGATVVFDDVDSPELDPRLDINAKAKLGEEPSKISFRVGATKFITFSSHLDVGGGRSYLLTRTKDFLYVCYRYDDNGKVVDQDDVESGGKLAVRDDITASITFTESGIELSKLSRESLHTVFVMESVVLGPEDGVKTGKNFIPFVVTITKNVAENQGTGSEPIEFKITGINIKDDISDADWEFLYLRGSLPDEVKKYTKSEQNPPVGEKVRVKFKDGKIFFFPPEESTRDFEVRLIQSQDQKTIFVIVKGIESSIRVRVSMIDKVLQADAGSRGAAEGAQIGFKGAEGDPAAPTPEI